MLNDSIAALLLSPVSEAIRPSKISSVSWNIFSAIVLNSSCALTNVILESGGPGWAIVSKNCAASEILSLNAS